MKNLILIHENVEERELLKSCFKEDESIVYLYNTVSAANCEYFKPTLLEDILNTLDDKTLKEITNLTLVFHPNHPYILPFFMETHTHPNYDIITHGLMELIIALNVENKGLIIDLLACELKDEHFKKQVKLVEDDLSVNIRYSLDNTGNPVQLQTSEGNNDNNDNEESITTERQNWFLESDNVDIKDYYFNEMIEQWNHVLYFNFYNHSKITYELLYDVNGDSTGEIRPIYTHDRHNNPVNTELFYDVNHHNITYNPSTAFTVGLQSNGSYFPYSFGATGLQDVISAVKLGNNTGYAVLKSDRTVYSWIYSNSTNSTITYTPTQVSSPGSNVIGLYSTDTVFVALKEDGTIVSWHVDSNGFPTIHTSPVDNKYKTVYTNNNTYVAIRENGSIEAWGLYGSNTIPNKSSITGVVTIYSSSSAFVALKSDGTLIGWGNSSTGASIPSELQTLGINVRYVYSNMGAFAALTARNELYTWGGTVNGGNMSMLNIRYLKSTNLYFILVATDNRIIRLQNGITYIDFNNIPNVVEVYPTYNGYALLTSSGAVNSYGRSFSTTDFLTNTLTDVEYVTTNFDAMVALKSDGSIQSWGRDVAGGLHKDISFDVGGVNKINLYTRHPTYKLYMVNTGSFAGITNTGLGEGWGLLPGAGISSEITTKRQYNSNGTLVSPSKTFYTDSFQGFHVVDGRFQSGGSGSYMYLQNNTTDRSTYPTSIYRTLLSNITNTTGQSITLKSIYIPLQVDLKPGLFETSYNPDTSDNYYYYLDVTQKRGNVALFTLTRESTALYYESMKCSVELLLPNMVNTSKQLSVYLVNNSGGYVTSIQNSVLRINESFPKTMSYVASRGRWVIDDLPIDFNSTTSKFVVVDDSAINTPMFDGITISTITSSNTLGQQVYTQSSFLSLTMKEPIQTFNDAVDINNSNTYTLYEDVNEVRGLIGSVNVTKTGSGSFLYSNLSLSFVLPNMVDTAPSKVLRMYVLDGSGNFDRENDSYYELTYNSTTSRWVLNDGVVIDIESNISNNFVIIDNDVYDSIGIPDNIYTSIIDISNSIGQQVNIRSLFMTISCELIEPKALLMNEAETNKNNYFLYMGLKGVLGRMNIIRNDNLNITYDKLNISVVLPNVYNISSSIKIYRVDENNSYDNTIYIPLIYDGTNNTWNAINISLPEKNGALYRYVIMEDIVPTSIMGGDPFIENIEKDEIRMLPNHMDKVTLYQSSKYLVNGYNGKLSKSQIDSMHKYLNNKEYSMKGNMMAPLIYMNKYILKLEVCDLESGEKVVVDCYDGMIETTETTENRLNCELLNTKYGLRHINDKYYYPKKNMKSYIIYLDEGNYITIKIDNYWTELNNVKLYLQQSRTRSIDSIEIGGVMMM